MQVSITGQRGKRLVRPECVLATADGTLHVAHFGGGVTQIDGDGTQRDILAVDAPVPIRTNGFAIDANGDYLIANLGDDGGFWRLSPDGALAPLLTHVDGHAVPPANYVHLGPDGVIWGTVSTRHLPRSQAWRRDVADGFIVAIVEGQAQIAADGIGYANECQVSPDGRWLYVNETFAQQLTRYPIAGQGKLGAPERVADFGPAALPDGLAFDDEGGVWVICIITNEIVRIAPDGTRETLLSDHDPAFVAAFADALDRAAVPGDALTRRQDGRLANIASMAFFGPGRRDIALGVLLDDTLPIARSSFVGAEPIHWHWGPRTRPA